LHLASEDLQMGTPNVEQASSSFVHHRTNRRRSVVWLISVLPLYPARNPAIAARSETPSGSSTRTSSTVAVVVVVAMAASLMSQTRERSESKAPPPG